MTIDHLFAGALALNIAAIVVTVGYIEWRYRKLTRGNDE